MGTEEDYLDNLLKSLDDDTPLDDSELSHDEFHHDELNLDELNLDELISDELMLNDLELADDAPEAVIEEPELEIPVEPEEIPEASEASDNSQAMASQAMDISDITDEPDIPDITEIPDIPDITDIPDIPDISDEASDMSEIQDLLNEVDDSTDSSASSADIDDALSLADLDLPNDDTQESVEANDTVDDSAAVDGSSANDNVAIDDAADDNMVMDDVLSMLDDDADLAEINDILKKADNNEPIQDEMMDLLNQMADDEAAMVNSGVKDIVGDDGSVEIPDLPDSFGQTLDNMDGEVNSADSEKDLKKKKKRKKNEDGEKKKGAGSKFLNMLTEDLPGPTDEEYAAEAEAKKAKKTEAATKKEEEKLAKAEEKKAKAEEAAAAKKAKAEAAAQQKKEKAEAKLAKKKAKEAAQAQQRVKKIPRKKIVAVTVFGVSVFGGVVVATNILAKQGFVNTAKKAYYSEDYLSAYIATYGMELDGSDGLIQQKSEVIMKIQCWYDSYQNNLKLGREKEALNALICGIKAYDNINAEAEACGALDDVESVKDEILEVLSANYGLSEEQARDLAAYDDALSYTLALNDIINN